MCQEAIRCEAVFTVRAAGLDRADDGGSGVCVCVVMETPSWDGRGQVRQRAGAGIESGERGICRF